MNPDIEELRRMLVISQQMMDGTIRALEALTKSKGEMEEVILGLNSRVSDLEIQIRDLNPGLPHPSE